MKLYKNHCAISKELAESKGKTAVLRDCRFEKNIKELKEQLASAQSLKECNLSIELEQNEQKDRDSQIQSSSMLAWLSGRYICHFHFEITKRFKICRTCKSGN